MTSPEERIKMAEEMRSYVECLGSSIDSADIVETILLGTIRYRDADGVAILPTSHASLIAMLADLIDPTCEVESVELRDEYDEATPYTLTLSCGHRMGAESYGDIPKYCPVCGARVVSE